MDARDKKELEILERLLRDAAPALQELEPDPHLPARVRALARERAAGGAGSPSPARRWGLVTAGAAALAVAALIGGYVGYRAGLARAPLTPATTAAEITTDTDAGEDLAAIDAFWSAWSQGGFADDLSDLSGTGEVAE
jgi:hypothetical protein